MRSDPLQSQLVHEVDLVTVLRYFLMKVSTVRGKVAVAE
jgi:hypothetical protein